MSKWLEGRVAGQTRGTERLFSRLRTGAPWQRSRRVTLVHATRIAADQAYREIIDETVRMHPKQFGFVSFVSREAAPGDVTATLAEPWARFFEGSRADALGIDNLTELARWLREAKRNRFLLTAPLRQPGAVGSPAVAVATV